MQRPAIEDVTVNCASANEQAGQHVGPYKLLQKIGEGGMGVVYMAEQEEPVRRKEFCFSSLSFKTRSSESRQDFRHSKKTETLGEFRYQSAGQK